MKNNRVVGRGSTLFVAFICTWLLNSCGSGAVTATDPAAGTPLSVFPAVADVFPDIPTTFTVSGGTPAYSVFSSNNVALPLTQAVSGGTFTIVANSVAADTAVDITVRDAVNASTTAKANIRPSSLINQVTFIPSGPTGVGCGTGICSGGDAQVVVKAILNGIVLRSRPIRFDVFQGSFQIVTPGTNALVNTLIVNTDEQGEAVVRISTPAGANTQTATMQFTDTTSGLARRFNFNIIQQTSGVGILSTLPSGAITIKGAKGAVGQDGACPSGARVDFYVFGGTPPYTIASPLPLVATPVSGTAPSSGSGFSVIVNGCGTVSMIVTDSKGLTIETSQIISQQGDKGEAATATTLTVAPTAVTVGCGQSASVNLVGAGNFTASIVTGGVNAGANAGTFTVSPTAGPIPSVVTFSRGTTGPSQPTTITVNIVAGSTVTPVTVTTQASCP